MEEAIAMSMTGGKKCLEKKKKITNGSEHTQNSSYFKSYMDIGFPEVPDLSFSQLLSLLTPKLSALNNRKPSVAF